MNQTYEIPRELKTSLESTAEELLWASQGPNPREELRKTLIQYERTSFYPELCREAKKLRVRPNEEKE